MSQYCSEISLQLVERVSKSLCAGEIERVPCVVSCAGRMLLITCAVLWERVHTP